MYIELMEPLSLTLVPLMVLLILHRSVRVSWCDNRVLRRFTAPTRVSKPTQKKPQADNRGITFVRIKVDVMPVVLGCKSNFRGQGSQRRRRRW